MRSRLLFSILSLVLCLSAGTMRLNAANYHDDEFSFRFRISSVNVDPKVNPNGDNLSRLEEVLNGPKASSIERIELRASSSPEGPFFLNEQYAHERAEWVKNYITERVPSLPASVWQIEEIPEDWDGVADYLKKSTEDYKNEAMQIVRSKSSNRKELLQDLYTGEAWDDLNKYAFPWLRAVKIRIVYSETGAQPAQPERPERPVHPIQPVPPVQPIEPDQPVRPGVYPFVYERIVTEGTFPILFERSSSVLYQNFADNATQIARILQETAAGADSLALVAYASPEGTEAVNMAISKKRSAAVRDFLSKKTGIPVEKISVREVGEDWDGFSKAVTATYDGSDRNAVINTLIDSSLSNNAKESALKRLDSGRTWQSLINNQTKELRRVEVQCLKTAPKPVEKPEIPEVIEEEVDVPEEELEVEDDNIEIETTEIEVQPIELPEEPQEPEYPKPILGISTNILYDAVTAFNLGVEVPVADHWFITADAIYDNMPFSEGRKIGLLLGELGVDYYFDIDRPAMSGWFAQVGVGGGKYDLVGKVKERQGTILYTNLGAGYTFQLGPEDSHWRLKLAAGVGPLKTSFKYSERNAEGNMVYKDDRNFSWQLPTNVQASIIYLFYAPGRTKDKR